MIGEFDIDGVFLPTLLVAAVLAFCLTSLVKFGLRHWHLYRFVWHAGLFDVALYIVLLWITAIASVAWITAGVK